ncbi:Zrt2p [Saccharomyces cerevisiae x Saccharomyces kudriavzevii VIN7]|nr:Zrt2p [Saccharomyces cerevisiae x Saccharomyces kudriavzevii VIN7]
MNSHATNLTSVPGKDHYSHENYHQDASELGKGIEEEDKEQYLNQMLAVFILEFGIIFHSVFVGLSLSVAGEEFETLFIVLTFHQMFEGLGLGTRVAETNWPESKRYTPWLMGLAFTLTSPIAVAIGIGVRHSWVPGSRRALIANGVFDSISSGILIYTGLVELMAHEFLYSNQFKGPDGLKKMLSAYFIMCCGAALMALLGKWA